MIDLTKHPGVGELYKAIVTRQIGVVEVCRHYLERLERAQKSYNVYIRLCSESALERARRLDRSKPEELARLPLAGIPVVHKDNFCMRGIPTTCGSAMLKSFVPEYDAFVTQRLRQAGAVILAKANMDEFAMGSSNETSHFGCVKNPWDPTRVPGGSSGGSAVSVGARLAPLATGTDTGGSVRQPAALCGITGMKPSYGRVSRFGIVAFASSFDQAGLFANSAEDLAPALTAISGYDPMDSTCSRAAAPHFAAELEKPLNGVRVGVPSEFFSDPVHSAVSERVMRAAEELKSMGAKLVDLHLSHHSLAVAVYQILACAEASSNLARYDGVRYGYRHQPAPSLDEMYLQTRSLGFGDEVKRRIILGSFVLASGYQDRFYHKAQKIRRLICEDYLNAFQEVDVILGPTTPDVAFRLGDKMKNPLQMYMSDSLTASANLTGMPAISFCGGFIDGLPVGVQLLANYWRESLLLNLAHQYQRRTDWHRRTPPDQN